MKKAQLRGSLQTDSSRKFSELKDFVARNKARVATRNMAMSRQKKLDKMDVIELASGKTKAGVPVLKEARTTGAVYF